MFCDLYANAGGGIKSGRGQLEVERAREVKGKAGATSVVLKCQRFTHTSASPRVHPIQNEF